MAILQIVILFGVGSHFVNSYFGQTGWPAGEGKVVSRQRVGNLNALPPPIYGSFFFVLSLVYSLRKTFAVQY